MKNKRIKYNYDNKCGCEIFKDILDGKLHAFPRGFWQQPNVENECAEITKYFIEKILKWDENDILTKTNEMIFRKYHLSGMLEYVFGRSPFLAIDNAYPGKYKPWELRCLPKGFWQEEKNRNKALSWLLDKTGKVKVDELINKDFLCNGLCGLMDYLTENKLYENMDKDKIEYGKERNVIELNVTFVIRNTKAGRNKINTHIEIPPAMLKEIGIDENNRNVILKVDSNRGEIIIKNSIFDS